MARVPTPGVIYHQPLSSCPCDPAATLSPLTDLSGLEPHESPLARASLLHYKVGVVAAPCWRVGKGI